MTLVLLSVGGVKHLKKRNVISKEKSFRSTCEGPNKCRKRKLFNNCSRFVCSARRIFSGGKPGWQICVVLTFSKVKKEIAFQMRVALRYFSGKREQIQSKLFNNDDLVVCIFWSVIHHTFSLEVFILRIRNTNLN